MLSNLTVLIIILLIILIEIFFVKRVLGIVILHNNDHTLNKILQFIMSYMQNHEIHYQILVIKEKKPIPDRSTGYLFNIGMRQLSGFRNYLFLDTTNCDLKSFYTIKQIDKNMLFDENKINYFDKLCGISISKNYFKKMKGFTNNKNKSFTDFMKILNSPNYKGAYGQMNEAAKYDIVDKIQINALTQKITMKYI